MKNKIQSEVKMAMMLFFFVLMGHTTFSQSPPPSFISLSCHDTTITSVMTDSVIYYGFIPHTKFINARLNFPMKGNNTTNYALSLLDQNLDTIAIALDSNFVFSYSDLSVGNQYFIKIEAVNSDPYILILGTSTIVVYDENHICDFEDNCNLLTNSNFNNVFTHAIYLNSNNPLAINAFGIAQDILKLVDTNQNFYTNMVCDWYHIKETPVIGNNSPTQNYLGMWGQNTNAECAGTHTKVYPSISYIIEYDLWYTTNNLPINWAKLRFGFRKIKTISNTNPTSLGNTLYYDKNLPLGSANWHHIMDTFNLSPLQFGFFPRYEMLIYPQIDMNDSCGVDVRIDNIVLKPLSPSPPAPIVDGLKYICNSNDSIFTYSIANYDSLWVYFVEVNSISRNYSKKIYTKDFALDLGFETETTVSVTVCGNTTTFQVYRCCDPFQPADNALYYCNDTITTNQTLDGENISICGWLTINANVIIKNSDLKFGPESGIKVGSGYTLTLENNNLTDGCNSIWKGIYPTDSTSKIFVDSCYFEHANSALNSYFNSKLQVRNSVFENNNRGIHFRAYNPDKPIPDQNGYWYVAPSNAYVAGNTFMFTNSFVSVLQYISNPIGIQIDTIYKITIGDATSSSLINTFDSLRYGIKGSNSIANVYNASFNKIRQINYQSNLDYTVDNTNVPLEGAIHFAKTKLPPNSLPTTNQINKVIGNQYLTIGGDSGRFCNFIQCNFGIYADQASVQIKYNTFANQKYNAVYLKEVFDSHIENNSITHSGSYPNTDEILKASIQVRNIHSKNGGREIWVLNNIINNPTVGISLLNTSSTSTPSVNKYVKVGNNQIYFSNINQTSGLNYCGIKLQNCDRIRVAGNIIESNTNPGTLWDIKKMVGIHMAQCTDTWIADNYSIRKMMAGIYAVGHCTNSQFACNKLFHNKYGIYFEPYDNQVATMISSQGYTGRASDNEWFDFNPIFRIGGNLNMQNYIPDWYFRNDDIWANTYNPDLSYDPNRYITMDFQIIPNTNVSTQCSFQMTEVPEDMNFETISGMVRALRLNDIVMENIEYMILADEFEYFDQEYLYEILYNNPEILTLGEPHDTAYINFYNYITNTNIREFIELQELIDEGDLNAALQNNGVIVAQNLIETNLIATNNIYLNTLAQDVDLDSTDRQNLFVIAMLTPYVGGEGVYSARAMLGIDPEDYNLPYRKGKTPDSIQDFQTNKVIIYPNPAEDILYIEFEVNFENMQLIIYNMVGQVVSNIELTNQKNHIDIKKLKSGMYFYRVIRDNIQAESGKFIKH